MGATSSKTARTASHQAQRAAREYPTRPSPSYPTPPSTGPHVHPSPTASATRTPDVDLDARDPDFASRLSRLGPVRHPAPTYSPSSTSAPPAAPSGMYPDARANPAIATLAARERIAGAVEREKLARGRPGWAGRRFVDVQSVRRALAMRDERGMSEAEVEREMGLREGTMARWGGRGVVEAA